MKKENKKTIKSTINKILIGIIICTPIAIIILMIMSDATQDNFYHVINIAIYPILGIIASPNIIMHAIKNNKEENEEFYSKKEYLDKHYTIIDDIDKYYKLTKRRMTIKTIINIILTIIVILYLSYCTYNLHVNGVEEYLNNRTFIAKLIRSNTKVEGGILVSTFLLLVFAVPTIIYGITVNLHRRLTFSKDKIRCYRAIVSNFDLKDWIYIKTCDDDKNVYYNHKIHKDYNKFIKIKAKNGFKYYKCIGIDKKDIIDKEVTVVVIPEFAYLIYESEE